MIVTEKREIDAYRQISGRCIRFQRTPLWPPLRGACANAQHHPALFLWNLMWAKCLFGYCDLYLLILLHCCLFWGSTEGNAGVIHSSDLLQGWFCLQMKLMWLVTPATSLTLMTTAVSSQPQVTVEWPWAPAASPCLRWRLSRWVIMETSFVRLVAQSIE